MLKSELLNDVCYHGVPDTRLIEIDHEGPVRSVEPSYVRERKDGSLTIDGKRFAGAPRLAEAKRLRHTILRLMPGFELDAEVEAVDFTYLEMALGLIAVDLVESNVRPNIFDVNELIMRKQRLVRLKMRWHSAMEMDVPFA